MTPKQQRSESGQQVLADALTGAEQHLWSSWQQSESLKHRTAKGSAREAAVRDFLTKQLPERFGFTGGEAIDVFGNRTGQIDLMIYDRTRVGPFYAEEDDALMPAEAVLAAIEVKSLCTGQALSQFARMVASVHRLRPYKKPFAFPRSSGRADDGEPRVQSTFFGFKTDLGEEKWESKELGRLRTAAKERACPPEGLDRLVVLDRGLILPISGEALPKLDEKGVLRIWFFHLVNFLAREVERRKDFSWAAYADPSEVKRVKVGSPAAPGRSDAPAGAQRPIKRQSKNKNSARTRAGRRPSR